MRSSRVLAMIASGKIEELKAELRDEIYTESLRGKADAKKRYSAMKRYLKTISESRPILTKPCAIEFEGENYNSFTNSYSLALTKESCGELEMCNEPDRYPNVAKLVSFSGEKGTIDFNMVLAEAKSRGYKYTKNSIHNNDYLMHCKGAYFRIGLVDITYGIIDEGKKADVWFHGKFRPLTIKTDIGIGIILPIRYEGDPEESSVVINVEN